MDMAWAKISQALDERKNVTVVLLLPDWPDAEAVENAVKSRYCIFAAILPKDTMLSKPDGATMRAGFRITFVVLSNRPGFTASSLGTDLMPDGKVICRKS